MAEKQWTSELKKGTVQLGILALLAEGRRYGFEIIEELKRSGFRRIFIALNYRAQQIEENLGDGSALGVEKPWMRSNPIALTARRHMSSVMFI